MKPSEKNGGTGKSTFVQKSIQNVSQVSPNWVVILGGAIVSVLSIKLGHKVKQAIKTNGQEDVAKTLNEPEETLATHGALGTHPLHQILCCSRQDGVLCNHYVTGASDGTKEMKVGTAHAVCQCESENANVHSLQQCKLLEIPMPSDSRQNIRLWESLEQLDWANANLQQSNSPESVCTSDTGSDVYSKRDVIHRLRQQVKRRDEMILEMQVQINYQQRTIANQLSQIANLKLQLDTANMDLFGAEREIQRLRKAIADHCLGHVGDKSCTLVTATNNYNLLDQSINMLTEDVYGPTVGDADICNGGTQRFQEQNMHGQRHDLETTDIKVWKIREDLQCLLLDKKEGLATNEFDIESKQDMEKELADLKQLVSAKNHLVQVYEKQRVDLCSHLKELQLKVDTQVASVL